MSGETTEPQDPLSQGEGPASEKGSTSAEGQILTAEQIAKLRSDAAAEAGRQRKAAELERDSAKQQLDEMKARLEELETAKREAELAQYKGDPAKLEAYQRETQLTDKERKLLALEKEIARRDALIKEKEEKLTKAEKEAQLREVASKHGVTLDEVKELGIEPTVLDTLLTKFLKKEQKEEPKNDEWFNFKPDSGVTSGGTGRLTNDSAKRMPFEEFEKALLKKK